MVRVSGGCLSILIERCRGSRHIVEKYKNWVYYWEYDKSLWMKSLVFIVYSLKLWFFKNFYSNIRCMGWLFRNM